MTRVKRILSFMLVLAIALTVLVVPAAAATRYIPRCGYCNSTNLIFVRQHTYKAEGVVYYIENEYVCANCGKTTYIDLSLFN